LAGNEVFGCALEMAGLCELYAVYFCECFGGVTPHLEAAIAAFAILAIKGRVTVLSERFTGHVGLLIDKKVRVSPLDH